MLYPFGQQHFMNSIFLLLLLFIAAPVQAQEKLKIHLNREKDQHIAITGSVQFWLRYTELNPGSLVHEAERKNLLDFSVRRYRLNFQGKASERLRYRVVLGENNLNHYTYTNFNVRLLEAFADYQVNEKLALGIGKQGWTGLSRYAAPSATQPLAYDIDFVPIPLVVVYDDILRRLGVYARGTVNKWDYRLSLSRPSFYPASNLTPLPGLAIFADKRPLYQFSTYLKYQFREQEPQTQWAVGTYAGKKNLLTAGIGMLHQPNTTWSVSGADTVYHPVTSFAADLFLEQPLSENKAITLYASFHRHNLGPNFVRNIGINNPATAGLPTTFLNGHGNRAPVVGTGSFLVTQAGYLLPVGKQNKKQLQAFTSLTLGKLQALNDPMRLYNTGLHFFTKPNSSKITLGYENRPVFKQENLQTIEADRKGLYVLQYQLQF